jgi:multidrug transporter EmrE-like cation transporter
MTQSDMSLYWGMLAAAIATSMAGQTLLKAGAGAPSFMGQLFDPKTLAGLVLYGGAALLYIVALRRIPMSVALPFTAVSYIAAALIGYFAFGEPMGPMRIGAIGLIGAGVVVLALS